MKLTFTPINTETVRALQGGAPDAYGHAPEQCVSDGDGVPCRHCLDFVPEGAGYLVLAYRPFTRLHAYAETGPIFLCAGSCAAGGGAELPAFLDSPAYILRGYDGDERIVYGTGRVVQRQAITGYAQDLLMREDIAFVHVRSAANNCYHCRIERA